MRRSLGPCLRAFIPFHTVESLPVGTLLVDSGANPPGDILSVTHHKGNIHPQPLHGDSSTALVLCAICGDNPTGRRLWDSTYVTANHWDIDSFLAVWSSLHPDRARQSADILRTASLLGDFRDVPLTCPEADAALQLCCWLNTVERMETTRPFERREGETREWGCTKKFEYFLPMFGDVLENPDAYEGVWREEFSVVKRGVDVLKSSASTVTAFPHFGLTVIETPEPLHYYALFGETNGMDAVVTMYSGQRYEVEYKYTGYVDLTSRDVFPRLRLHRLVDQLNTLEHAHGGGANASWVVPAVVDPGPILRLEVGPPPSRVLLYGSPTGRPLHSSAIPPDVFQQTVLTFFEAATKAVPELVRHRSKWSWGDLKDVNAAVDSTVGRMVAAL